MSGLFGCIEMVDFNFVRWVWYLEIRGILIFFILYVGVDIDNN